MEIRENRQKYNDEAFWAIMVQNEEVWLYDSNGNGPIDPIYLPSKISGTHLKLTIVCGIY